MYYLSRISFFFAILFIAGSCTERMQPIYNAENIALPPIYKTAPLSDTTSAIERGTKDAGWKVKTVGPQEIEASLKIRVHTAVVRINYSDTDYSITYNSSTNLPYTGTRIHKNYNLWIERLQTKINNSLQLKASEIRAAKNKIGADPGTAWEVVKDSESVAVLREFLRKHQDSPYAPLAIKRLNEIGEEKNLARAAPVNPPRKPVSNLRTKFDVTGNWRVDATYLPFAASTTSCSPKRHWNFSFFFRNGITTRTVWSNGEALYITAENSPDFVDLRVEVPNGGSNWQWSERLNIDKKIVFLRAEAATTSGNYGNCIGTIEIRMEKLD
ncbi:MAG: hypothetical protein NXI13_00540 [Proteobacteria bacterium]|nr:hypothetical protein [Pseudomonadota bacterium]